MKKLNTIVFCPQLGHLFLIDKNNFVFILKYKEAHFLESSHQLLINSLQQCDEIEVYENETIDLTKLQKELNLKTECYLSLHFLLNIFNKELSESIRIQSLNICEDFFNSNIIYFFVKNRLLSKPLPENADFTFIISLFSRKNILKNSMIMVSTVIKSQNILKAIDKMWKTLSLGFNKYDQLSLFYEKIINDNVIPSILNLISKKQIERVIEFKYFYKDDDPEVLKHFELFLYEIVLKKRELYDIFETGPELINENSESDYSVGNIEFEGMFLNDISEHKFLDKEGYIPELISNIAHELRTPANSIMGFASLLNEENLTSSQSEYVATLKESAFNLLSLLNDLIDLAKLEKGKTKDSVTNVNVKNFIDNIVNLFTGKVNKNNIDFLINIGSDVPEVVKLDSLKLRYILINIITFSMRLTERGKITISVSKGNLKNLNFKISDTSSGLTSNRLKDIFKPFIISELTSSKIGSITGLSLILAKKYIESLKGNLDVTSMVGKGITYNFTIGMEAFPIMSAIETQISTLPKSGKKNRVLVVEDDYATSKLLSSYLKKWGYEPVIVNAGEQALKATENEVFLAVLMDIVLPDMNGFELLKTLRENKNTKHTPVIVCSVETEQQKAFLMGAVEYFVKPINYNFLVEVLTSYKLKKDSNILIVDDDVPTLNLMKETVIKSGFNAVAESHSLRVGDMIDNMNLDLAIIDLDMPELNGYDLIKQIKSKPKFNKLPIIIYTGKENYQEDLKKIDGMFEELLEKNSVNIEDLSETVNAMINKYDEPASPHELITKTDVTKILIVEDYKHSQIIVTRLLKKNNFDSIVVVENGLEALEEVKKQKYDLIIMDMQMPVMNGFEATEKIRKLPDYKETPIIALTAFAMKGDREKCLEAGATDYIPKPISENDLIKMIRYYLFMENEEFINADL